MDIKVPNLGDIDEVEVIEITVAVGDTVSANDTLIVIESDKASMDVPAEVAGTITALHVSIGDMVGEGALIASLETAASSEPEAEAEAGSAPAAPSPVEDEEESADAEPAAGAADVAPSAAAEQSDIDVLVPDIGDASGVIVIEVAVTPGQVVAKDDLIVVLESDKASMEITAEQAGEMLEVLVSEEQEVEEGTVIARMRVTVDVKGAAAPSSEPPPAAATPAPAESKPAPKPSETPVPGEPAGETDFARQSKVYAGPATRRLARELGVDLGQVEGSGNRGRILKDDVKAHVKARMAGAASGGGGTDWPSVPAIDFSRFGEIDVVPLSRIRQRGAENLHRSWVNLPHVTQHNEADVTDLEAFRSSLKGEAERRGLKLTPLAFIIKAVVKTLSEFPEFNSSLHEDGKHLVLKKYVNVGMAVDTPEGLVVPVIRDADALDVWELTEQIVSLSQNARDKKLKMDDLSGGTFSVSSLGALGGTGFTPIVNAPEVAILGVARLQHKPVWNGTEFLPRKVLPLSLSYDHRVINGADGGRFMLRLTELLEDIRKLAL